MSIFSVLAPLAKALARHNGSVPEKWGDWNINTTTLQSPPRQSLRCIC
jgi:hypothetical protein